MSSILFFFAGQFCVFRFSYSENTLGFPCALRIFLFDSFECGIWISVCSVGSPMTLFYLLLLLLKVSRSGLHLFSCEFYKIWIFSVLLLEMPSFSFAFAKRGVAYCKLDGALLIDQLH